MAETGAISFRPRKCILRKWDAFSGYGFYLHELKEAAGHFIGGVEPDSPAASAELRRGDRIVEVNGTNVHRLNHYDVVKKIKQIDSTVTLLVLDLEADRFYDRRGTRVHGGMEEVEFCEASESSATKSLEEAKQRTPRSCLVRKSDSFQGYGFNLHGLGSRAMHLIGTIDKGSPAEAAGLQEGDVIVEVNGANVEKESHEDLISRIISDPSQVRLLVISHVGYDYYQQQGISIHSGMSEVGIVDCSQQPKPSAGRPRKSDLELKPGADHELEMSTVISGVLGLKDKPNEE